MLYGTTFQLLQSQAEQCADQIAIVAPERGALTYKRLFRHVQDMIAQLNELGVGRNDRVAIVLPNGPEMAVAFLAIASAATSAPLNPSA